MPLKGASKRNYNKINTQTTKTRLSERKKVAYQEELQKSCTDTAICSKVRYDKICKRAVQIRPHIARRIMTRILEKDTAGRSKVSYNRDLEKRCANTAGHKKVSYNKDLERAMQTLPHVAR